MKNNNLLKKFLSFSYGNWLGIIIGIISTPVITRILSPEDFGKASMFTLAINILMIFIVFGTDQSFVRFFYEEKDSKRGGLLYNCLKLPFVLMGITTFLILVFYKKISILLFDEANLKIIIVLVIGIFFQAIYRFGVLVIRMQQKGHLFSLLQLLQKILNFILILFLFELIGAKYEIIIYAMVISIGILSVFSIFKEKKFWSIKNINLKNLKHNEIEIIKYSAPLVVTTLITWLFQSFDRIAIKQWSGLEELGLYVAAFKIVALLNIIQTTFTTFWTPVCYEHYEKSPNDKEFYKKMNRIITIAMLLIGLGSIMFKELLMILLGKEYKEAIKIMPFLIFMPIMYTISETTVIGISFYKKNKWHILISGISCIVNIVGNWLLVPRYGAVGAAISTAFSYIVFFSMRTFISLKYYKVDYGLKKFYSVLVLIILYSFLHLINNSKVFLDFIGVIILCIGYIIYRKDIRIYKIFSK